MMVRGSEVPFANVAGVVIRIVEVVGECGQIGGGLVTIAPHSGLRRIFSGLETGAGRSTNRLARETFGDVRALLSDAVEVGSEVERATVHTGGIMPLLIGQKDDYIGLFTGNHGERNGGS